MEVNGAVWVQIVASIGVLTPLVLGILGFVERRSKAAAAKPADATVQAGVQIDPLNDPVSLLRERVTALEKTIRWVTSERDYYYAEAVRAGADVEPPRINYG